MSLNHSPAIVTDGLVLCLDAGNSRSYPKSGTTWTDLKGSNNGTLLNSPTFSSSNRGEIVFDFTDDQVNLGISPTDILADGSATTISAWFKTGYVSGYGMILGNNGGASRFFVTVYNSTGSSDNPLAIYWGIGSGFGGSSTIVSTGVWYNYVVTYDQSVVKAYLNATQTESEALSSGQSYGGTLRVGGWSDSNLLIMNGSISALSIYNRALTADEVRQNYEATVGRYT